MSSPEQVRERWWYHSLELGPDLVTEGFFDLRPYVHLYGLPERMDGMRALEVGCWDGFWSFEMERRGAEVTAIDLDDEAELDWPARRRPSEFAATRRGDGFRLAKEILGSRVERLEMSVYDATPERLGSFDLVLCGSVLIHLRDQVLALERIAELSRGTFISAEEYDRPLSLLPVPAARYRAHVDRSVVFWRPNLVAWRRMMAMAGFDRVQRGPRFSMRSSEGFSVRHAIHHCSHR